MSVSNISDNVRSMGNKQSKSMVKGIFLEVMTEKILSLFCNDYEGDLVHEITS